MEATVYQNLALQTEGSLLSQVFHIDSVNKVRLINGLMGLNGEAGEAIDLVKKCLFQGHDFEKEKEHLAKELGDVAWYLSLCADAIGYTLDDILKMNLEKLKKRYPNGFAYSDSILRKEGDQ